jgi:lipopolysaccharide assembly outer membrane protein LptD (OstA)
MQNKFFFILFLGLFFFKTNLSFSQDKSIYNFSADKLTYSQDNNIIEASGNVVAKNQDGKKFLLKKSYMIKKNRY